MPYLEALERSGASLLEWMEAQPKKAPLPDRMSGVPCSRGCGQTVWVNARVLFDAPTRSWVCDRCTPERPTSIPVALTRDERLETAVICALRLKKHADRLMAMDWGSEDFHVAARAGEPQRLLHCIEVNLDSVRSSLDSNEEADQALRDLGLEWLAGQWVKGKWNAGVWVEAEDGRWSASRRFAELAKDITNIVTPKRGTLDHDAETQEWLRVNREEIKAAHRHSLIEFDGDTVGEMLAAAFPDQDLNDAPPRSNGKPHGTRQTEAKSDPARRSAPGGVAEGRTIQPRRENLRPGRSGNVQSGSRASRQGEACADRPDRGRGPAPARVSSKTNERPRPTQQVPDPASTDDDEWLF
jgi:hypothetical protein